MKNRSERIDSIDELDRVIPRAWNTMDVSERIEWMDEHLHQREVLLVTLKEMGVEGFEFSDGSSQVSYGDLFELYEDAVEEVL